ncbi:hypothetical protein SISNIDRAFT_469198 [Sistotremastrum niveocremeum HHB9708]|uniref:Uncharacterized protein n=1 Tax=Sistotremastrum niveocremeum HHB9708 TaxID=1314777 RepID=A0A164QIK3_9AGAM|nr:hypothetical protein SISNIDRAFT_469198 [Sistotremastrum niveocremeum HHB9708]
MSSAQQVSILVAVMFAIALALIGGTSFRIPSHGRTHEESMHWCTLLIDETLWELKHQRKIFGRQVADLKKKAVVAYQRGNMTIRLIVLRKQEHYQAFAVKFTHLEETISSFSSMYQELEYLRISLQTTQFSHVSLRKMINMISMLKKDVAGASCHNDTTVGKSANQHIAEMASAIKAIVQFMRELSVQADAVNEDFFSEEMLLKLGIAPFNNDAHDISLTSERHDDSEVARGDQDKVQHEEEPEFNAVQTQPVRLLRVDERFMSVMDVFQEHRTTHVQPTRDLGHKQEKDPMDADQIHINQAR